MNVSQIKDALHEVYKDEHVRVVFWNDPDGEFKELLSDVVLEDVVILSLNEIGALEAKVLIEQEDTTKRYLLYSPTEVPSFENDWLLDMRLYGRSFRADRASIILRELGLNQMRLREHLSRRRVFFDSKERLHRLAYYVTPEDSEIDLDCKMLAVVTKADQAELFNIIQILFHSMATTDEPDLEFIPPAWSQIEKFDLDSSFWTMIKSTFGYDVENPTLQNLLIRLMVSDYTHHLKSEPPSALQHLQLSQTGTANAVVCLAQWRDSSSKSSSYNLFASEVAAQLHMEKHLQDCELEDLLDVMTFSDVDKRIVQGLLDRVTSSTDLVNPEAVSNITEHRKAGHWISSNSVLAIQRNARRSVYDAIASAAHLLNLRSTYAGKSDYAGMATMYKEYETKMFRIDQLYRHFCENSDVASAHGWDMLKPLREEIEAFYCNEFLVQTALTWGKFVDAELPNRWAIGGVQNQYTFFDRQVQPWLEEAEKRRAFVIISDALRYEAADELKGLLNGTYRFEAELYSLLGILPSYTALGMASLLPHSKLAFNEKGEVLVDGKPTTSLEHRGEILSSYGGIAVKADTLLAMRKGEGRKYIAGKRFVYIYHDEIDARGDKATTEGDTFEAVRKTIHELADLVRFVVNNLNANYVVITADHGFLFTETIPSNPEKSKLNDKPTGTVIAKKRYLLGYNLPTHEYAWRSDTAVTAVAEGGMQFWVPKGNNLFHLTGGARFVHGGAMLQEIVVPVIKVKHLKDKGRREKTRIRHVPVQVLGSLHKITTHSHRFNLLQVEPVGERSKPITLKVAVYEGSEPVTTIESVTFDSTSSNLDERRKTVVLTLRERFYDKHTLYRLVLRNADTGIELASLDVTIDRAITDDFDF